MRVHRAFILILCAILLSAGTVSAQKYAYEVGITDKDINLNLLNLPGSTPLEDVLALLPEFLAPDLSLAFGQYDIQIEDISVGCAANSIIKNMHLSDLKSITISENPPASQQKNSSGGVISPVVSKELYESAAAKGVEMLDAPVSGGEPKAIDGTMSIMVGGKQEVFDSVKNIFKAMGDSVVLLGDIGSGQVCKLSNQIMVALHLAAVGEAMVFAEKAGVDPEKVYQAIRGGLAGSTVLDAKMDRILDRNFKPGGPIWMHTKDLLNVRDAALAIDAPIPLTTQVLEAFKACKCDGHSGDDHCGVIQYWEKLANVTVKRRD